MYIHKEGHRLLLIFGIIIIAIYGAMIFLCPSWNFFHYLFASILLFGWIFFLYFFRMPRRKQTLDESKLIAPADGTICAIEQTFEKEYLNCECIQLSVFMYGTDVHVNRYPISGTVEYVQYHKGNYFVASHPKSSTLNEHSSIGLRMSNGQRILIRQVAGVMARRIVCYAKEGEQVKQNQELGFIKFGSRVDLFLPLGTEFCVGIEDSVRNSISPIAILQNPTQQ